MDLLTLIAWCAPEPVPLSLLKEHLEVLQTDFGGPVRSPRVGFVRRSRFDVATLGNHRIMIGDRVRRVIAQQWVSADGFAAGPTDETEIFAAVDDLSGSEEHNRRLLEHVDEVLLGRRSYESIVGFWPLTETEPMAEAVNAIPKVVCSTTLREAPWAAFAPAQVVPDAVTYVRERRREPGGDLLRQIDAEVWPSAMHIRYSVRPQD